MLFIEEFLALAWEASGSDHCYNQSGEVGGIGLILTGTFTSTQTGNTWAKMQLQL